MAGMVIIGAGECGTRVALALREAGYDGAMTLIGGEPHAPYERPPLSKDALAAEAPASKAIGGGSDRLAEFGVDFRPSRETLGIDRTVRRVLLDGETAPFERLLFATGARHGPCRCPGPVGPTSSRCVRWTTRPASAPRSGPASASR